MMFGAPLVVIDCCEHAFYIKGDYVSAYPKFIDWSVVERRVQAAMK